MTKRDIKSKQQLLREIEQDQKRKAKIDKEKFIARTVFPFVENLKIVYDAQTAVNAASGYIASALANQSANITVKDLDIKVADEGKDTKDIQIAVENIIKSVGDVSAKDVSELLERMGNNFAKMMVDKGLKEPMTIKTDDFVA